MSEPRSIGDVFRTTDNPLFKKALKDNPTVNLPLFTQPPEKVPYPETRDVAYRELIESGKLSNKQAVVLAAIDKLNFATDLMIAYVLDWPINLVCGRRNELMQAGYIEKHDEVINAQTNRPNIRWKIKR